MNITSDRDGLAPNQIQRINRLELARYQQARKNKRAVYWPLIGLLSGIFLLICATALLVHNRWSPGTKLYTRLPSLNEQTPSITIYAEK